MQGLGEFVFCFGSKHLRKSLSNNEMFTKLKEQKLQWPHTTKNYRLYKNSWEITKQTMKTQNSNDNKH